LHQVCSRNQPTHAHYSAGIPFHDIDFKDMARKAEDPKHVWYNYAYQTVICHVVYGPNIADFMNTAITQCVENELRPWAERKITLVAPRLIYDARTDSVPADWGVAFEDQMPDVEIQKVSVRSHDLQSDYKIILYQPNTRIPPPTNQAELAALLVSDLEALCKANKLHDKGKKKDLQERLRQNLDTLGGVRSARGAKRSKEFRFPDAAIATAFGVLNYVMPDRYADPQKSVEWLAFFEAVAKLNHEVWKFKDAAGGGGAAAGGGSAAARVTAV